MDAVAVGGWFLHAGALALQLEAARMEEQLALRARLRFPHFHQVLLFILSSLCALGKINTVGHQSWVFVARAPCHWSTTPRATRPKRAHSGD